MDVIIGSGIALFTMYAAAKWKDDDKKKIQHTFNNIGYKVKDHTPTRLKTIKRDSYIEYVYNVPYGLIDDPKLQPVIEKTLHKSVRVYFDGKLHIRVYKQKLNKSYPYSLFPSKGNWTIPVGMAQEGIVYHDFDAIPHMTIAGATTWGKTVFMKMLMTHLIENNPDGVEFYILDLKGKLAFNKYAKLKQVKAVAGDIKESARVLKTVKKDIKTDMENFLKIDAENAKEANSPTRKFIIVDEAGELVPDKTTMSEDDFLYAKTCQQVLSYIARVSGQLGYKLIFGTQYPTADILNNQIKANSLAKVSFRLSTSIQSNVAIDQKGAELLEYPGRAIYKTVKEHLVQTPNISKKEIWEKLGRYEDVSATSQTQPERREDTVTFG